MKKEETKKLVESLAKTIEAMAFSRDTWVAKTSQRLEGALGEYAKSRYSTSMDSFDYWSDEVENLMSKVTDMFDPSRIKIKQKFDRYKAFQDAVRDSLGSQEQITSARNEFISFLRTTKEKHKFLKISKEQAFKSEKLLIEMLSEYLPEDILAKARKYLIAL